MRVRKRIIKEKAFQHLYQNTCRGVLLFYNDMDRLVYYTAFSVTARKYHVQVLAFALMYDHTHSSVRLQDPGRMGDFVRDYTSVYALEFNRDSGRHGPLFRCAYGNSSKLGAKRIRTNVNYIGNNSVEKKLFERAEQDRWNLLAYMGSSHPFSERIDRHRISRRLLRSLKRVDAFNKTGSYLNYRILRSLFDGLDKQETEQLTDYIINLYMPIDKQELFLLYEDYQTMLTAINSNTGSEYDLKEDFDNDAHTVYRNLLRICRHSHYAENPKAMLALPMSEKRRIAELLQHRTGATYRQLCKFLDMGGT